MPEINHVFSQGKMNKDLDERIVPNGQYRDAMNIQISTSEGSDVGAVQNILGNSTVSQLSFIPENSVCIGAVADEKNNNLYWFVAGTVDFILQYSNSSGSITPVLVDINKDVLEFNKNTIITGINIIDNLLLWTDNSTEPKKINIETCQRGTDLSGLIHTKLVVVERDINNIDIRKEHITVIKKAPKEQVVLGINAAVDLTGSFIGSFENTTTNQPAIVGDIHIAQGIVFNSTGQISVGDILLFKQTNSPGSLPSLFDIKVKVLQDVSGQSSRVQLSGGGNFPPNSFKVEIITTNLDVVTLDWQVFRVGSTGDAIFDKQLARFSCRYKYQDGEYSTFAPFSEIAFVPSSFNYETKRAFNTGMQNYLKSLFISNFVQQDILEDVVQIDILYKESNSTNVYIVDKIKFKDSLSSIDNVLSNNWISNTYNVTSDIIYALLPSNQLLRPYDNVPVKALAQEITGNRVVYGNYVQNYNLDQKPVVEAWYDLRTIANQEVLFPNKSLKSLRNYQLGVTYLDDFGRETPVFTDSKSTFKIPKNESASSNQINFQLTSSPPDWAKSYKMFVKETSNEYYNLAMDRVYRAKDGNIWLSFPSSDRNKVDEQTFLILKKQLDADTQVAENLRYKIIAIENEAPDFVKSKPVNICDSDDIPALFQDSNGDPLLIPSENNDSFQVNEQVVKAGGSPSLDTIEEALSIRFEDKVTSVISDFYNITSVTFVNNTYTINLDRNFSLDDTFIYTDYDTATAQTPDTLNTNLILKFYKSELKNKPEFDGRFFVKIENDASTEKYVLKSAAGKRVFKSAAIANAYYLSDTYADFTNSLGLKDNQDPDSTSNYDRGTTRDNGHNSSELQINWQENFHFDAGSDINTGEEKSKWFIDQAFYKGTQKANGKLDASPVWNTPGYGRGVYKEQIDGKDQWYMELSFGNIIDNSFKGEGGSFDAIVNYTPGGNQTNARSGDLNTDPLENLSMFGVGTSSNESHIAESKIVSSLSENKLFKFLGDQQKTIYKINGSVQKIKRYNYMNYEELFTFFDTVWRNGSYSSSSPHRYFNYNDEGYNLDSMYDDFGYPANRRVTWVIPFCVESLDDDSADPAVNSNFIDASGNDYDSFLDTTYGADNATPQGIQFLEINRGDEDQLISSNPAIWETEPKENIDLNIFHEASGCFDISTHDQSHVLDWYNCYSFGNGVESNRVRDDFNQLVIDKGAVVSSTTDTAYKEERRKSGLIYSGLYNSINGVNNLNQFIAAEKITKDLNPTYGSIQKLFSRNTDLVSLCEDRIVRILANKDAIFNADGNPNLVATTNVLGQTMPFSGDYGISKNPESFVSESYRAYFTDKQRGVVLRLSMDGLTPISQYGMSDYFKDNLKTATNIVGTYDTNKDEYNVSLIGKTSKTITFNEDVKGWSGFKSFIPEQGLSMANDYYTFKHGILYKHHLEQNYNEEVVNRNTFYGDFTPSHVSVLLNDDPSSIKSYKTLNYTGSKSWYAEYIESEKQKGLVDEFVKKEGKWFNFIKGEDVAETLNIKTEEFSFQGIGIASYSVGEVIEELPLTFQEEQEQFIDVLNETEPPVLVREQETNKRTQGRVTNKDID
tara:strand:+ start:2024 stop:6775 length:4752 start_codon:yes stop_codon:yes gene_type:complete